MNFLDFQIKEMGNKTSKYNPSNLTEERFLKAFNANKYKISEIYKYYPVISNKYSDSTVLKVLKCFIRWVGEGRLLDSLTGLLTSGKISSAKYIIDNLRLPKLVNLIHFVSTSHLEIRSKLIDIFWDNVRIIMTKYQNHCLLDDSLFLLFSSRKFSTIPQKVINHYAKMAVRNQLNKSMELLIPYADFPALEVNKRALLEYAIQNNLQKVIASLSPANVLPAYEKVTL